MPQFYPFWQNRYKNNIRMALGAKIAEAISRHRTQAQTIQLALPGPFAMTAFAALLGIADIEHTYLKPPRTLALARIPKKLAPNHEM